MPITLTDVREVSSLAREVVASFERDFGGALGTAEVHHVGATSLPFGQTKGDVDVNVRVEETRFATVVDALRDQLAMAQPDNWTPTFASFATDAYALPLGVQVTVIESPDDFLLALRDRMRADAPLLRRYNDLKVAAASDGPDAYWQAKDALFRELLTAGFGCSRERSPRRLTSSREPTEALAGLARIKEGGSRSRRSSHGGGSACR